MTEQKKSTSRTERNSEEKEKWQSCCEDKLIGSKILSASAEKLKLSMPRSEG